MFFLLLLVTGACSVPDGVSYDSILWLSMPQVLVNIEDAALPLPHHGRECGECGECDRL